MPLTALPSGAADELVAAFANISADVSDETSL